MSPGLNTRNFNDLGDLGAPFFILNYSGTFCSSACEFIQYQADTPTEKAAT